MGIMGPGQGGPERGGSYSGEAVKGLQVRVRVGRGAALAGWMSRVPCCS